MISAGNPLKPRPLTKIVGGLLSSTNGYSKEETIETNIKAMNGLGTLDIGCIADYGSFYINYNGKEDSSITNFQNRYDQYYENRQFESLVFSSKENSLVTFFLQLTRYLQQAIGTIPAIDLNSYSESIDFKIDEEL